MVACDPSTAPVEYPLSVFIVSHADGDLMTPAAPLFLQAHIHQPDEWSYAEEFFSTWWVNGTARCFNEQLSSEWSSNCDFVESFGLDAEVSVVVTGPDGYVGVDTVQLVLGALP